MQVSKSKSECVIVENFGVPSSIPNNKKKHVNISPLN
jgi:hypothetical protein